MVAILQRMVVGVRLAPVPWPDLAAACARLIATQRGRFTLWLPVLLGVGVLVYFAQSQEPPGWLGAAAAGMGVLTAVLLRRPLPRALAIGMTAAAIGFAAAQLATWRALPVEPLPSRAVFLTGAVRAVEALPNGERVMLDAVLLGDVPYPRRLRIRLRATDPLPVVVGATIRVRALVRAPSPPAYPGGWDLQRDAFFSGIGGYGYAIGPAALVAAPDGAPRRLVQWLRQAIDQRIAAALPGATGAIAATLLTGITSAIPEPDRAAFRDSGLAHLLAVAGLHVGIVMGLFAGLARALLALSERAALHWPCKQLAALAALAAGGCYMMLTGMHVPIMRSFAMATLFTLAVLSGRRAASLRGWALAATALLLLAPSEITGVSFQMSFAAVLALIVGWQAARPLLWRLRAAGGWRGWLGGHVGGLALTSVLAGVASAPYGAFHFGRVQLYFVLSNLVAVPLTATLVMPAGLLALALMPFGLERLALLPMGWGVDGLLWIARSTAALPAATFAVPHMPEWGLAALSLGLLWGGLWRGRLRLGGVPLLVLGLASPLWADPPDILVSADGRLVAARTAAGLFVQQSSGASQFTLDAWRQFEASSETMALPSQGSAADGAIVCAEAGCLVRPRPDAPAALIAVRGASAAGTCPDAELVVAVEPRTRPCEGAPELIARPLLWRAGSVAAWLRPDGVRLLTDRAVRGARPWVPEDVRPTRAAGSPLPPAATETLPPSGGD